MREERARHTHIPTLLQTPPTQTVGSPDLLRVRTCILCVCAHFTSTQSINPEIVFTLHIIGEDTSGVLHAVFPLHSGMPIPHIRRGHTLWPFYERGTHSHRLTLVAIQPDDLLPRIHRVSAVSGDDDSSFSLLLPCVSHYASMLLTLDHWTKIDSTAAAAATFQLFLFDPFSTLFHTLFINSPFLYISSFANHCFPLNCF